MMKNTILFILMICQVAVFSQIGSFYTFLESSTTYTELSNPTVTSITSGEQEELVNLPFPFIYAGTNVTSFYIGVNGAISFTSNQIDRFNNLSSTDTDNLDYIGPLWDDLNFLSGDNAEISHKIDGTMPNRTFTIQWKNVSWQNVGMTDLGKTVNFQIILEESTNDIHFIYGPNTSMEVQTASIGINKSPGGTNNFLSISPSLSGSTTTVSSTSSNDGISTFRYPGDGVQYTFEYMDSNTVIVNPGELFVDSGGTTANYSSDEEITYFMTPTNPGELISVEFTQFRTENNMTTCLDGLTIYDGPDTFSNIILTPSSSTVWCGTPEDPFLGSQNLEGMKITSSHPTGSLTFRFTSNGDTELEGWQATVTSDNPLGVEDEAYKGVLTYFPNPIKNVLYIESKEIINELIVYNLVGQKVMSTFPDSAKINMGASGLDSGIYIAELKISNTTEIIRFIKE